MEKQLSIILIGAPGSGKGTQGTILSNILNYQHISTGDVLRSIMENKSELAKELAICVNEGRLVSDELMNDVLEEFLKTHNDKTQYIFDGYPRNLGQAAHLLKVVPKNIVAVFLNLEEEAAIARVLGRRQCLDCSTNYNIYTDTNSKIAQCPKCQSTNVKRRLDDTEQTIKTRLAEYKKETLPIIQYYQQHIPVLVLEADQSRELITNKIVSFVKNV